MASYAQEHRTFFYNLKRYGFSISKDEIRQVIITSLIIAFVWSFNKFGDTPETWLLLGATNFAFGGLFAFIAIIFNQIGQRVVAVYYGYDPIYEYCMIGLMIALVITFASRGFLIFFLPGAINIRHLSASRLGEFRYYTNDWEWAKVGFMGPFMNIMLALFASPFKDIELVRGFMIMNILFAVFSLIPLPSNLGLYLFYPHIYFWMFTVSFVAGCSLLMFFVSPLITVLAGLLLGVFGMFYMFQKDGRWTYEK
jgi:hypothetical protein